MHVQAKVLAPAAPSPWRAFCSGRPAQPRCRVRTCLRAFQEAELAADLSNSHDGQGGLPEKQWLNEDGSWKEGWGKFMLEPNEPHTMNTDTGDLHDC